jgi:hypothetical protein
VANFRDAMIGHRDADIVAHTTARETGGIGNVGGGHVV